VGGWVVVGSGAGVFQPPHSLLGSCDERRSSLEAKNRFSIINHQHEKYTKYFRVIKKNEREKTLFLSLILSFEFDKLQALVKGCNVGCGKLRKEIASQIKFDAFVETL